MSSSIISKKNLQKVTFFEDIQAREEKRREEKRREEKRREEKKRREENAIYFLSENPT